MDKRDKPDRAGPAEGRAERERRLARALRDNLRRRKDQARNKAGGAPAARSEADKPDKTPGSG